MGGGASAAGSEPGASAQAKRSVAAEAEQPSAGFGGWGRGERREIETKSERAGVAASGRGGEAVERRVGRLEGGASVASSKGREGAWPALRGHAPMRRGGRVAGGPWSRGFLRQRRPLPEEPEGRPPDGSVANRVPSDAGSRVSEGPRRLPDLYRECAQPQRLRSDPLRGCVRSYVALVAGRR